MTPEMLTDVFMEWFTEAGLIGKVDADETALLAEAFGAGYRAAVGRLI